MKIYGNNFSFNSNKTRFTANLLGLDYEFITIDLSAGEQRQEKFLKVNPVGRIPALTDGDFVIFESVAICRYLAEKSQSTLYPQDLVRHSVVNQWLDFGSIHLGGAMGKMFFNTLVYKFVNGARDEKSYEEGRNFFANFLKVIEHELSGSAYLAGPEVTLADLNLLAILDPSEIVGFDLTPYPKVVAWRNKLRAQAFYQKVFPSFADFVNSVLQTSGSRA